MGIEIRNESFYTTFGWMMNELKLKGNELSVYAIIYGFSQDGISRFRGSVAYLGKWINASKPTVISCLKKLVEKRLIEKFEKYENGVKFCEYSVNHEVINNLNHQLRNFTTPSKESLPNNIDNNIADNIDYSYSCSAPEERTTTTATSKSFVKPSVEEIRAYCNERNNGIDAEKFYDYYEARGWKLGSSPMKDWKATLRGWERRKQAETNEKYHESDFDLKRYDALANKF